MRNRNAPMLALSAEPQNGDLTSAEAALKQAGFTESREAKTSATFTGPAYTVSVASPGRSVTYTVTKD